MSSCRMHAIAGLAQFDLAQSTASIVIENLAAVRVSCRPTLSLTLTTAIDHCCGGFKLTLRIIQLRYLFASLIILPQW